jgi:hypothetical protein
MVLITAGTEKIEILIAVTVSGKQSFYMPFQRAFGKKGLGQVEGRFQPKLIGDICE